MVGHQGWPYPVVRWPDTADTIILWLRADQTANNQSLPGVDHPTSIIRNWKELIPFTIGVSTARSGSAKQAKNPWIQQALRSGWRVNELAAPVCSGALLTNIYIYFVYVPLALSIQYDNSIISENSLLKIKMWYMCIYSYYSRSWRSINTAHGSWHYIIRHKTYGI